MAEIIDTTPQKSFEPGQTIPAGAEDGWKVIELPHGVSYRIKAEAYNIADNAGTESHEVDASGPPFAGFGVNWPYASSASTDQNTADVTAITWYRLDLAPWYSPYKYRLTVNVTDTYNYTFHDATGTSAGAYRLDCWQTGTHSVDFDSPNPTIVSIDGA